MKKLSILMFLVIGLIFSAVLLFKVSTSAYAITLQCQDSSECIKAYPSPPMFCSDGATMQYKGACEGGECNYIHYWVVPGNPWGCTPNDSVTPTTPTPTSTDCNFTGCPTGQDCLNGSCVFLTTPTPTSGFNNDICSTNTYPQCGGVCPDKTYGANELISVQEVSCTNTGIHYYCSSLGTPAGQCGNPTSEGSTPGPGSGPSCPAMTCQYSEANASCPGTGLQWVKGTGCTGDNCVIPGEVGCKYVNSTCSKTTCIPPSGAGGTPVPTVPKTPTTTPATGPGTGPGSGGSACSGNTCNDCVLNNRPDVLTFYKNNGWDTSCGNQSKIVQDWCGIDPSGCSGIKSGTCSSSCGGSGGGGGTCSADIEKARLALNQAGGSFQNSTCDQVKNAVCNDCSVFVPPNAIRDALCPGTCGGEGGGACTVSNWSFSNSNPPANTLIKATVKGVSDPGGWQNVVYKKDNDSSWVQPAVIVGDGPTFSFDVNSGTNGNHAVTLGTSNGAVTCSPTGSFTTGGTPTPTTKTTHYRISQTKFDKADTTIAWQSYSSEPTTVPVVFTNLVAGQDLTVFVQFKADDGSTSEVLSKSIKYSPPVNISSVVCNFDPSGTGTLATLIGNNFGVQGQGQVSISGQAADIISWTMQKIVAKVAGKPTASAKIQIGLKTDSMSQPMTSSCQLDTSSVDFDAKIGCRALGDFTVNDVDVTITEATTGAKPQVKEKIQLDQSGHPVNFSPVLEASKKYWMLLKAPKSVTQKVEFVGSEGSVVLPDMKLPIGNIAPQGDPDTQINAFDKSELVRQWLLTPIGDQRTGDLSQDGAVNSIDWSCMRADYNKEDQK